jgi:hypothetical protein
MTQVCQWLDIGHVSCRALDQTGRAIIKSGKIDIWPIDSGDDYGRACMRYSCPCFVRLINYSRYVSATKGKMTSTDGIKEKGRTYPLFASNWRNAFTVWLVESVPGTCIACSSKKRHSDELGYDHDRSSHEFGRGLCKW